MADPEPESDASPSSRPLSLEAARPKRSETAAGIAIGAVLLLPLLIWGYFEFYRSQPAAAPRAEADAPRVFQPLAAPAMTSSPAPSAPAPAGGGDRMMLAPEAGDRMLLPAAQEAETPSLKPLGLPDSHTASIQSSSLELYISDPGNRLASIVVEVNDLQVNRYALRAVPSQKIVIPLPNLPVYQFDYKGIGRDGKLLARGDISFLRSGQAHASPPQFDAKSIGIFQIGVTYNGPYHVTGL